MDFVMLNSAVAPTNDLRVRQALAMGLDQEVIQKIFGGGLAQPTNGIFLPGSPYYSKTGYPTYDPTAAKKLVAEYKAEHGTLAFQLVTIPDPRLAKVVQVIQQMWQQIGFTVTIKSIEQATLISNAITGNFQAATFYQFAAPDPGINYVWWSTTTVSPVGGIGLNFARNSDPQIQQALTTARSTTSSTSGSPPTRRSTSGWRRTCPTCGWGRRSGPRSATSGSRTSPTPPSPTGCGRCSSTTASSSPPRSG